MNPNIAALRSVSPQHKAIMEQKAMAPVYAAIQSCKAEYLREMAGMPPPTSVDWFGRPEAGAHDG